MTAANVPMEPVLGFPIGHREPGAAITSEREREWGLALRSARADATAHALDRRPICLLLCLRLSPRFLASASGDPEGVSDAT